MTINRREMLGALAGLPLLASAVHAQGGFALDPTRLRGKNVLLIMADDAGRDVFGYTGGSIEPTPNIDALARQSLDFNTCYATPLCTTSRIELLTGLYPFESGWPDNPGSGDRCRALGPELETLGNIFKEAGYRTGLSGKWHLSHADVSPDRISEAGFDEWLIWAWRLAEGGKQFNRYWQPSVVQRNDEIELLGDAYGPDVYAGFLLDFMARAAANNEPFFAYYPMILTHSPFCPTPGTAPDFSSLMDETTYEDEEEAKACTESSGEDPDNFPQLVRYTDQLVGQMLEFLDRRGLRDNTVVIFTTDNGTKYQIDSDYRGMQVSGGKGTLFDLGINMPLLINAPGVAPAHITSPVDFTDLHRLIADMGRDAPQPSADGGTITYAMSALAGSWTITDGQWKLTSLNRTGYADLRKRNRRRHHRFVASPSRITLYHIAADPLEQDPIAPLEAMANEETRGHWHRLQTEADRRLSLRQSIPAAAHYPHGNDECWDED